MILALFLIAGWLSPQVAHTAAVTWVSIPINSQDSACYPVWDSVWSSSIPYDAGTTYKGIGHIINPGPPGTASFALHDHQYLPAGYIPDPTRAVVTYRFDQPVIVAGLEIVQHTNGITRVEGFVGNAPDALSSVGSVFGPDGDVTGSSYFSEFEHYLFSFDNDVAGTYFQFVIRKTSLSNGFADYRAFPMFTAAAVPLPPAIWLLGSGLISLIGIRARLK